MKLKIEVDARNTGDVLALLSLAHKWAKFSFGGVIVPTNDHLTISGLDGLCGASFNSGLERDKE